MKLDDVRRLQACYWTAKNDPSIIEFTIDEVENENDKDGNGNYSKDTLCGILNSYYWYPEELDRK